MKHSTFAASRERAVKLMAEGCPIDYPDALALHSASLHVEQLIGYGDGRVYKLGLATGWVIPLRLRTDRPSGTVITDWDLALPGQNHAIDWDYEPEDIIPKKDRDDYQHLLKSRLRRVLEGRLLPRGYPVDGVLCGISRQPMEVSFPGFISARLSFTDDLGNTVWLRIHLNVHPFSQPSASRISSARRILDGETGYRLFAEVDSEDQFLPDPMPAVPEGRQRVGDTRLSTTQLQLDQHVRANTNQPGPPVEPAAGADGAVLGAGTTPSAAEDPTPAVFDRMLLAAQLLRARDHSASIPSPPVR